MRWLVMAICVWSLAALPPPASAQAPEAYTVGCKGTFGPEATQETLARTFGSENVRTVSVGYESSGRSREETLLFPIVGHSAEIRIIWAYDYVQERPKDVMVYGGNLDFRTRMKASPRRWRSAGGVEVMMTLQQLEALNGRPFKIIAQDTRGYASVNWDGGRLGQDLDGCRLDATLIFFDVPKGAEWGGTRCPLCPEASSADPTVRSFGGHVYSFAVRRDRAASR